MVLGTTYLVLVSFFGIERTLAYTEIQSEGVSNWNNFNENIGARYVPDTNQSVCGLAISASVSSTIPEQFGTISLRKDNGSNLPQGGTNPSQVLWYTSETTNNLDYAVQPTYDQIYFNVTPCVLLYQSSTYWIYYDLATTTSPTLRHGLEFNANTSTNTLFRNNGLVAGQRFGFALYGAEGTISENLDFLFGTSTVPSPTVSTSSIRLGFENYFPECYTAASSTNWWSAITGADYKCVMKEIIYSGAVSLFVPGQQSAYGINGLEFFNENVNAFTQVFPFNIFFNFSETIRTIADVQETTAQETNFPLPWGTTIPMINSSTISRIIGTTNYDNYQTLQDSIIWIATGMLIFSSL